MEFEQAFAKWLGVRYALGVASGTDALQLALRSIGVGAIWKTERDHMNTADFSKLLDTLTLAAEATDWR